MRWMPGQPSDKTKTRRELVTRSVCADPFPNTKTTVQPMQRRPIRDWIQINHRSGETESPYCRASSKLPGPSSDRETLSSARQKPTGRPASRGPLEQKSCPSTYTRPSGSTTSGIDDESHHSSIQRESRPNDQPPRWRPKHGTATPFNTVRGYRESKVLPERLSRQHEARC